MACIGCNIAESKCDGTLNAIRKVCPLPPNNTLVGHGTWTHDMFRSSRNELTFMLSSSSICNPEERSREAGLRPAQAGGFGGADAHDGLFGRKGKRGFFFLVPFPTQINAGIKIHTL